MVENQKNKKDENFEMFYTLSVAAQLGFFVMVPIIGFIFLGRWFDKIYNYSPFFLIFGLLVGLVVAINETYQILKPILDDKSE